MKVTLGTKEGHSAVEISVSGRNCPERLLPSLSPKGDWTGDQGRSPDGDCIDTANPKGGQTSESPGELLKKQISGSYLKVLVESGLELRTLVSDGETCTQRVGNHWTTEMLNTLLTQGPGILEAMGATKGS